jgi:dTMP kinase
VLKSEKMNRGAFICFVGVDGSGKTTLSRYLYEELKKRGYSVSYVWWLEGENSSLRRFLRKVGRTGCSNLKNTTGSVKEGEKAAFIKIFRVLWPKIVLLDYLRFGLSKVWFRKIVQRDRVVIFDRFIYDIILGLSEEFGFREVERERLLKIFSKLLPNPDLIFIMDVPPEVSYSRKRDEIKSIEQAKAIWENYQKLYSSLSNLNCGEIVKIDNAREIEMVKEEILNRTLKLLDK